MAHAIALAFVVIVFAFAHAQAQNTTAHTISVSGYGNIQSLSDIAVVSFFFSGDGHWPTYLMLSQCCRFSGQTGIALMFSYRSSCSRSRLQAALLFTAMLEALFLQDVPEGPDFGRFKGSLRLLLNQAFHEVSCVCGWPQVSVQVSSTQDLASDARANVSATVSNIINALGRVRLVSSGNSPRLWLLYGLKLLLVVRLPISTQEF